MKISYAFSYSRSYEKWAPVIARIIFGGMFLFAASAKIPGTAAFAGASLMTAGVGVPLAPIAVTLAFILEFCSGIALLLGWNARIAATVLIPYIALLTVLFHLKFNTPVDIGFFIDHLTLIAGLIYVSVYNAQ